MGKKLAQQNFAKITKKNIIMLNNQKKLFNLVIIY